ncbi:methyltransferase domain-containing protein [Paenibacillus sp. 2TAB26]|uniref:methyltransferase domain-containing protein n=1 Tax=Paenibacillus sp. 2TAB26 TaxID=3233005 RepID=UPI003F97EEC9
MSNNIYENEAWWQENGFDWANEVDKRRAMQPLYGIQEVVLTSIFSNMPKQTKVLEFGVGFGRHAEYLDMIPNVEFYGVDQSPTMLESLKERFQSRQDLINRITLIEPRSKLPFPDNYFDFVYTVSVLIHIQPEHLSGILAELVRVSKHGILHFENNFISNSTLQFPDHNGCWQHSIIKEYELIGQSCTLMTKVSDEQDLYYTQLTDIWPKGHLENQVMFSRLKLMDQRIRPNILKFEGEVGWRTQELKMRIEKEIQMTSELNEFQERDIQNTKEKEAINKRILEQELKINNLIDENNEKTVILQNKITEETQYKEENLVLRSRVIYLESRLHEIESSLAWRIINKLRNMDRIYRLTKPLRKTLHIIRKLKKNDVVSVDVLPQNMIQESKNDEIKYKELIGLLSAVPYEKNISIHQPEWLGVTNSTNELFSFVVPVKELLDSKEIKYIASLINNRKPLSITFSGFAIGYFQLAKMLKELNPNLSLKIFWHGNTTHMYEDYSWYRYQEIIQLVNEGIIDAWGFAKQSMATLYERKGFPSFFILNTVNLDKEILRKPIQVEDKIVRIGVYASGNTWNKNAFTQIAAAALIDNVQVNAIPYTSRMKEFAQQLNIDFKGIENAVPREELLNQMMTNNINLYVTFSECAPLLVLESLDMGVPCLTGPNHHYFQGSPLADYLIVSYPDDPVEISKKIRVALQNKDEIIRLYQEWKVENNRLAKQSIETFLGGER